MGREKAKALKRSINQEAWDELNEADNGKGNRLVIPNVILNHANYRRMSFAAKAVVWDIAAEYTGHNNGYLSATRSEMLERNWPSPVTLKRAVEEAVYYGLLFMTQQGGRNKTPNLYALSWRRVNHRPDKPLLMVPDQAFRKPLSTWKEHRDPMPVAERKPVKKAPIRHLRAVA